MTTLIETKRIFDAINESLDQFNQIHAFAKKTWETALGKTVSGMTDFINGLAEYHKQVSEFNEGLCRKGVDTFKKGMEKVKETVDG